MERVSITRSYDNPYLWQVDNIKIPYGRTHRLDTFIHSLLSSDCVFTLGVIDNLTSKKSQSKLYVEKHSHQYSSDTCCNIHFIFFNIYFNFFHYFLINFRKVLFFTLLRIMFTGNVEINIINYITAVIMNCFNHICHLPPFEYHHKCINHRA